MSQSKCCYCGSNEHTTGSCPWRGSPLLENDQPGRELLVDRGFVWRMDNAAAIHHDRWVREVNHSDDGVCDHQCVADAYLRDGTTRVWVAHTITVGGGFVPVVTVADNARTLTNAYVLAELRHWGVR